MLILALDTTTRAGSIALVCDGLLVSADTGDPGRTHGERLPGDIVELLNRHNVPISAIDLYAVAAGPGSFTGLRIGIATMQGLALANGKDLAGISALDALALAAQWQINGSALRPFDQAQARPEPVEGRHAQGERNKAVCDGDSETRAIAVWMDAQRREVFGAIYEAVDLKCLDGPVVAAPEALQARWQPLLERTQVCFVGDGAIAYGTIMSRSGNIALLDPTPMMAPAVATLAAQAAAGGQTHGPEAVRPLYVRRPDAELARDRRNVRVDR